MAGDRLLGYQEGKAEHGVMLPPGWDRVTNERDIYTATSFARDLIDQSPILSSSSLLRMGLSSDTLDQAVSVIGTTVNERYPFYEEDQDILKNGSLGQMLQRLRQGPTEIDCRVTTVIALEVLKELYKENIALRLANDIETEYRRMPASFPMMNIHPLIMYNPIGVDFSSANILHFKIPKGGNASEMKLVYSAQYQRLVSMGEFFEYDATAEGIIAQEQAFINGYRAAHFE